MLWCGLVAAGASPAGAETGLFAPPQTRAALVDSDVVLASAALPSDDDYWIDAAGFDESSSTGSSAEFDDGELEYGDLDEADLEILLAQAPGAHGGWSGVPQVASPYSGGAASPASAAPWNLQLLPRSLIYRSYFAGSKEPRFRSVWNYEQDDGWIWDITLGGRAGILRYGSCDDYFPQGFQLDIEGAALLRLDPEEDRDVSATDYRFGVPLTYGWDRWQAKFAYYHISSHLGDERMLAHPDETRINLVRDALTWGLSYYPWDDLRLYGELGWAFYRDISQPLELQFGFDYSPYAPTGLRGAPFVAANVHLREELQFGGPFAVQFGWQWRGRPGSGTFRLGAEYYQGADDEYQFFRNNQEKIGVGIWYDF